MNKTVLKLRPASYWRIGEHESWFSDMAANGLYIKRMGLYLAKFVKGEPQQMRYRIDVTPKKKMMQEQIDMYADCGWDYVTSYNQFHVFSSLVERNAPEIHTDPAEQAYTLKELDKKLKANAAMTVIALILIIGMLLAIWFLDRTPVLMAVEGSAIQQTIIAMLFIYLAYQSFQAAISIRALRNKLSEGKPVDHHAPWKKHFRRNNAVTVLFLIYTLLSLAFFATQFVKKETKTLPSVSGDLPIVRLADIERDPAFVRGASEHMSDGVDWSNRYTYHWSLFAPVQYETDENGVIPGKPAADGSGDYSPELSTKVFQLTFPLMADELLSDLVKWYNYDNDEESFIEMNHPELDRLIVHETKEYKEVFASKGKAVMYVRYCGNASFDLIIGKMAEKMELISK